MDALRETVERALGAQYDVLRLIGRGGMGAVYLARERLLERLVAVKVLPHDAATADGGRERFLREARTAARLSHPHIVPLYSFAEAEGTLLYVMGYVDGESLESKLAREGRVAPDDTRRILADIAAALDYAHRLGVVHRDVKPDNILLESDTGHAVLTDFGVAKQGSGAQTLTRTGVIIGTPHYMSPEQATAERDVDGRSDIYSLGVIGYRMISGRLPFHSASLQKLLTQHVVRDPVPLAPSEGDAGGLTTAVMRCLRKDPADRWPTAAALEQSLRPRDGEELELPEDLAEIPSMATNVVFAVYGLDVGVLLLDAYARDPDPVLPLIGWMTAAPLALLGLLTLKSRRHPDGWRGILRMSLWAPGTWWGWWPKALRRPGDVWPRLPREVRVIRTLLTAGFGALFAILTPLMLLMMVWVAGDVPPYTMQFNKALVLGTFAVGLTLFGALAVTVQWTKRFVLSPRTSGRLVLDPTWNNARFWNRPEIQRILESAKPASSLSQPRTPADYVDAISQTAAALPDVIRPVLTEAADAARELARGISAVDAELAELSRDADPAERTRLEQKLSAMRVGASEESEPRKQMRDLIAGQIALLDRLETRRRQLADDRERHIALLKNLWLQIASLKAEHAHASLSAAEISGRLRRLCDEIERQRLARAEVERMLSPRTPSGEPMRTAT